jgi:hypothetical protein
MKRNLVTTRDGRRTINWPVVLLVSLIVGAASGGGATLMWFLLLKEFSVMAIIIPAALSLGWCVGTAIRQTYIAPSEPAPLLDWSNVPPRRPNTFQHKE